MRCRVPNESKSGSCGCRCAALWSLRRPCVPFENRSTAASTNTGTSWPPRGRAASVGRVFAIRVVRIADIARKRLDDPVARRAQARQPFSVAARGSGLAIGDGAGPGLLHFVLPAIDSKSSPTPNSCLVVRRAVERRQHAFIFVVASRRGPRASGRSMSSVRLTLRLKILDQAAAPSSDNSCRRVDHRV